MLWAPLYDPKAAAHDTPNLVWQNGVRIPLTWMEAFLEGKYNNLQRRYSIQDYMDEGVDTEITVDASPEALGGTLTEDGVITEYFMDDLSEFYEHVLGHRR